MNEARFEQLVRDHRRAVQTYAQSLSSTPTIAEEAVQDTFLRAWKYLDSFRGSGSYEGWLIRICRRCVLDLERKERKQESLLDRRTLNTSQEPEGASELLTTISRLPIDQREVVVICGVLGYDYQTASTILDVPVGTVRSRLHRGRTTLSKALNEPAQTQASA